MKERLRQFMLGRYGQDDLNILLSVAALVLIIISMFAGRIVLYPLSLILLVICFYRMLSKNTAKRSRENHAYLRLRGKPARWFTGRKDRFKQRKTHCFCKCPSCRSQLRVPKGKGRIVVTCPKCRTSFEKKT